MPEPQAHPQLDKIIRVARNAMLLGLLILGLKALVFYVTDSAAVLADALESIINLVAAGFMLYSLRLSNRPADDDHPYGHGKVEFMAVGFEGVLILVAGLVIGIEGVRRLIWTPDLDMTRLYWGTYFLGGVGALVVALGVYVWVAGRRYDSDVLVADGKHLLTDALSTVGGLLGLVLVQWTGRFWVDPAAALVLAAIILMTSWALLWQGINGLMDRTDPKDTAAIHQILDDALAQGRILGYHKVRHRHTGRFHWVDMHVQVQPDLTVRQSHELASDIENQIEQRLGQADATAHVEPYEETPSPPPAPGAA